MVNKLLLCLFFIQVSYSQELMKYEEDYIFLSQIEFERIIEINAESTLDGNYYIVDQQNNISTRKYTDGVKVGEWISFHNFLKGFKLNSIENYAKGELNGFFFKSDNHTYTEKGYYKNGKKNKKWEYFTNTGDYEKVTYKNGEKNGAYYSKKGGIESSISYKNGKKHGKYYSTDGLMEEIGFYKNDKKHNKWIYRPKNSTDEKFWVVKHYTNGVLINEH